MKGVLKMLPLFREEEQRNRKSAKKSTLVKGIEKTDELKMYFLQILLY
jgi:hypothetical protein